MLLNEHVVEKASDPIYEKPPDEDVGSIRSKCITESSLEEDGSPVSLFKSRTRQKETGSLFHSLVPFVHNIVRPASPAFSSNTPAKATATPSRTPIHPSAQKRLAHLGTGTRRVFFGY